MNAIRHGILKTFGLVFALIFISGMGHADTAPYQIDAVVAAEGDALYHTSRSAGSWWVTGESSINVHCDGANYNPWEWNRDTGYMQYSLSNFAGLDLDSISSVYIWLYLEYVYIGDWGEGVGAGNLYHKADSSSATGDATQGIGGDQWTGLVSTQPLGWVGFDVTDFLKADLLNGYAYSAFSMSYTFGGEGTSSAYFASGEDFFYASYLRVEADDVYEYYPSGRLKSKTMPVPDESGSVYYGYTDEDWTYNSSLGVWQGKVEIRRLADYDEDDAIIYKYVYPVSYVMFKYATGYYKYENAVLTKISTAIPVSEIDADLNGDGVRDLILAYAGTGLFKYVNNTLTKISSSIPSNMVVADLDGSGADDIIIDYGASGLYKYVNNSTLTKIASSDAGAIRIVDLNGDGKADILTNLGTSGFYKYVNSVWTKISSGVPENIVTARLNGGNSEDLILDYGDSGLYKYVNNSTLTKIASYNAGSITVVDLNNDGKDDFVTNLGTSGFYKCVNSAWTKISSTMPVDVIVARLDSDARADLILDCGSGGIYKYTNNSTLTKIASSDPGVIILADLDRDGIDEVITSLATGYYKYQGSAWIKISTAIPANTVVADINGDGRDDLVLDYGATGLFTYVNDTLTQIASSDAGLITIADLNGDGVDDMVTSLGTLGLYKYVNSTWVKISTGIPANIKVEDLNGSGKDNLVLDYGTGGVYKYVNNALTKISSSQTDGIGSADVSAIRGVAYGYHNEDYTDLRFQGMSEVRTTELLAGGNVYKDTMEKKFGQASARFMNDGSDDFIGVPGSYKWNFEQGAEWTVDGWFNLEYMNDEGEGNINVIMCGQTYAIGVIEGGVVLVNDIGQPTETMSTFLFTDETTITTGQWYHLAMVADGIDMNAFIDGVRLMGGDAPVYIAEDSINFGTFAIGGTAGEYPDSDLHGWIDDFRISDWARWYDDFTPPESQAEMDQGTIFLLNSNGPEGANNFSSTTQDDVKFRLWDADGHVVEEADVDQDYYARYQYSEDGYLVYKKEEAISSGMAREYWYFDNSDNRLWQYNNGFDGSAGIYFDASGYKYDTYWSPTSEGTISHWETELDFDANLKAWYKNSSGKLEVYTYWENGQMKYKDLYVPTGENSWVWWDQPDQNAASWDIDGNWTGWKTMVETGASETFSTPSKPSSEGPPEGPMMMGAEAADLLGMKDAEAEQQDDGVGESPKVPFIDPRLM